MLQFVYNNSGTPKIGSINILDYFCGDSMNRFYTQNQHLRCLRLDYRIYYRIKKVKIKIDQNQNQDEFKYQLLNPFFS